MKKTHLLLMLALCATLLASCSAGEPDVTQTQPVPSIIPTNTPDENTVLPGLDDDIILPDGGRNDSTTREATGVTSMDKARRVIEQLEEELERLSEVKEAHVIIAGHKAAVALTFDDQYKAGIDDRFRKIVRERIDSVIGGIDTVALTTDKTVMDALEALQDRLDSVSDMSSLQAELDKILETMNVPKHNAAGQPPRTKRTFSVGNAIAEKTRFLLISSDGGHSASACNHFQRSFASSGAS